MRLPVKITARNYRCFGHDNPLSIQLDQGFTALTGPNNGGKSAVLKFFVEFRQLFARLSGADSAFKLLKPDGPVFAPSEVASPGDIFTDTNREDMELEFEFRPDEKDPLAVQTVRVGINRRTQAVTAAITGRNRVSFSSSGLPQKVDAEKLVGPGGSIDYSTGGRFFGRLAHSVYVPSFRNCLNVGPGKHYDLPIGIHFIGQFDEWKNGDEKRHRAAIEKTTEDIRRLIGCDTLEINPSRDSSTFRVIIDRHSRTLTEVGSGIAQLILILSSTAVVRPAMILIDEPELSLHPSKQIDLLRALMANTSESIVVFATHALGLARTVAKNVYTIRRDNGTSEIRPFEHREGLLEFLGEMNYSMQREVGVEKILFVEGVTDVLPYRRFLRLLGKEHQFLVAPLLGDLFINKKRDVELSEFKRLGLPCFAIIDSERKSPEAKLAKNRLDFQELWTKKLGFRLHILDRRALENYFPEHAIRAISPTRKALGHFGHPKRGWKDDNARIAEEIQEADLVGTDLFEFLMRI